MPSYRHDVEPEAEARADTISTSGGEDDRPPVATKANLAKTLARTGYPQTLIDELLAVLHEPIDARQAASVFGRYGITPEVLMDRLGASP